MYKKCISTTLESFEYTPVKVSGILHPKLCTYYYSLYNYIVCGYIINLEIQ